MVTWAIGYYPNEDDWDATCVSFFDTEEEARAGYAEMREIIRHTERDQWWIELYTCGEDVEKEVIMEERGGRFARPTVAAENQMSLF